MAESKAWTVSVEPADGNLQAPDFPIEPANSHKEPANFSVEITDKRKGPLGVSWENECWFSVGSVLVQC